MSLSRDLLNAFLQTGQDLFDLGLITSHAGNLSVREGETIWITRSGSMLRHLSEKDLLPVPLHVRKLDVSVSIEFPVHQAIYQRTSAGAVIHAHPVHAIALSLTQEEIRPADAEGAILLKQVPVLISPSVDAVSTAEKVAELLKHSVAVLVRSHGCFVRGKNLEETLSYASSLEASCRILHLLKGN
jgi:L-fuculose-phosphate aldolase